MEILDLGNGKKTVLCDGSISIRTEAIVNNETTSLTIELPANLADMMLKARRDIGDEVFRELCRTVSWSLGHCLDIVVGACYTAATGDAAVCLGVHRTLENGFRDIKSKLFDNLPRA